MNEAEIRERAERALKYDLAYGSAQDVLDLLKEWGREKEHVRSLTAAAQDKWEAEAVSRRLNGLVRSASKALSTAQEATNQAEAARDRAVTSPGLTLCEEGCLRERFAAAWETSAGSASGH